MQKKVGKKYMPLNIVHVAICTIGIAKFTGKV